MECVLPMFADRVRSYKHVMAGLRWLTDATGKIGDKVPSYKIIPALWERTLSAISAPAKALFGDKATSDKITPALWERTLSAIPAPATAPFGIRPVLQNHINAVGADPVRDNQHTNPNY